MNTIKTFEDIEVWKLARELNKVVYSFVRKAEFSKDLRFVSQITAAAGSLMDNIAEGFEREGNKEFIQFLFVSKGSCGEVQSQLYRAFDCGYITQEELENAMLTAKTISTKIKNFITYLHKSDIKGNKYKPTQKN